MFTGLVESTAEVLSVTPRGEGAQLALRVPFAAELALGESIAVNGCCLTAATIDGDTVEFDLLRETLDRTDLGAVAAGSLVNLERAILANARLGGHFVQGHIDTASEILDISQQGPDWRLEIALTTHFARYVVNKGSICVDGISLTVADLGPTSLICWIIPHTFQNTNLHTRQLGDRVNLEFDLLAKYVERLVAVRG